MVSEERLFHLRFRQFSRTSLKIMISIAVTALRSDVCAVKWALNPLPVSIPKMFFLRN